MVKSDKTVWQTDKLETILEQMREATDRRKELEKEHSETVNLLREKQTEIQQKFGSASEKSKAYEAIEALQSKIRELEKKAELQNVRHEELVLEMAAIKRTAKGGSSGNQQNTNTTTTLTSSETWNKPHQNSQLSPDSAFSTPDTNIERTTLTCNSREYLDPKSSEEKIKTLFIGEDMMQQTCASPLLAPVPVSTHPASSDVPQTNITSEIDRIMAKIDQDNRILAELDKTRLTIGCPAVGNRQLPIQPKLNPSALSSTGTTVGSTAVQPSGLPNSGLGTTQDSLVNHGFSSIEQSGYVVSSSGLPLISHLQQSSVPLNISQTSMVNPIGSQCQHQFLLNSGTSSGQLISQQPLLVPQNQPQSRIMPQIPAIVNSQFDFDGLYNTYQEQHDSKLVDMLDIPGKGRCYVYIAKYSYDPFQQSPNECPEAELVVNAGDYLLVWGNMDEDGFFDGELLDGRRGLVPSNFVHKLVGDDLLEFHQSVVQCLRDSDDVGSTNLPQDLDYQQLNSGDFSKRISGEYDLSDIVEEEEEEELDHSGEGPVAAPKQLTLERQLNKSVLIGWNHPDSPTSPPIECYHIYVDGVLKVTVKASERPRSLVEGVDSNRPHRISVRSVTANRRTSRDAACTMVIGKDVPLGPTNVKATRVTATSAVISWLPSNSNYQHTVCVNNVELRTVKPGIYRHTITGLAPNTVYRVTVRAKNIRAPHFDEKASIPMERYSCHIDFRTLHKGLPEPPGEIQVEPGPQDGTVLVTWQPVPHAPNNGSVVTGYAVYADGKKVTDVDSPTGDHALIDINKLLGLNPKQVTVRTKSRDNQSPDSVPTQIPLHVLKGKHLNNKSEEDRRLRCSSSIQTHLRQQQRSGQMIIETEENLSDKEIYPNNSMSIPAIEITKDTGSEVNLSEEDYMDRRCGGRGHYDSRGVSKIRSHQVHHHPRHTRRDERDPFHTESRCDSKGRHERDRERGGGGGGYRGTRGVQPQSQHQPSARDKRIRWFVALFDYDPQTMSPNPDACEEELPFQEGDSIKVYGDKDVDGFYWGECRGRRGFVPHNMVVEVQNAENGVGSINKERIRDRDRWNDIYANVPAKKLITLYDYETQELSPNTDMEMNDCNLLHWFSEVSHCFCPHRKGTVLALRTVKIYNSDQACTEHSCNELENVLILEDVKNPSETQIKVYKKRKAGSGPKQKVAKKL